MEYPKIGEIWKSRPGMGHYRLIVTNSHPLETKVYYSFIGVGENLTPWSCPIKDFLASFCKEIP